MMTESVEISKSLDIHYSHRVPGHQGKCRSVHGHRGTIEVTVAGFVQREGAEDGMVTDFGRLDAALESIKTVYCHTQMLYAHDEVLKTILKAFDAGSASVIQKGEAKAAIEYDLGLYGRIIALPFVPTAENLAAMFFRILARSLDGPGMRVVSVRFWETRTSVARYSRG